MARIVGSEIDFNLEVPDHELKDKCQDIWDNPEKYSEFKNGSATAYYSFLKYLWIENSKYGEVRMVYIVEL